jgi:SAM-dependent methyltransferase
VLPDTNKQALLAERTDARTPTVWLYAGSIFLSAFLLFQVQPILAKLILPWFGGAAAVWIISLAFYQLTYLVGTAYAHFLIHRGSVGLATRTHGLLLLTSLLLLPIIPGAFWQPSGAEEPIWRILGLLTATVGLPFLLLSATNPLLQTWHVLDRGRHPYRFYALSNVGSLLALLSYPVVVEPLVSTRHQAWIWSVGYGGFVALCATLAFRRRTRELPPQVQSLENGPDWTHRLLWLFLAACASALLLSITHHVSQDIAAVPLLWIVPLSLYLLSLVLCFEGERWYARRLFLPLLPLALAGMAYALLPQFERYRPEWQISLYFAGLFICCMVCHGEMAALKPRPEFLTSFYLFMAAGGAGGGLSVALLAPHTFSGFYELPLALGACALVVLVVLLRPLQSSNPGLQRPVLLVATALTALLFLLLFHVMGVQDRPGWLTMRNFYGVLRVGVVPPRGTRPAVTQLRHGIVVHGEEIRDPARRDLPTTYYAPRSGVGIALLFARQYGNLRVGAVGLGVGTIARYSQLGDRYIFYEINPLVIDVARNLFGFLDLSEGRVDIVSGDARLSLERESPQNFDVLVVDAFSGDAIPVHLLTREALELYFRHLKPYGVLAIHVTNRLLNFPPMVAATAEAVGARAVRVTSAEDDASAVYESVWMLLDRKDTPNRTVSGLAQSTISLPAGTSTQVEEAEPEVKIWTDDYSNLLQILK